MALGNRTEAMGVLVLYLKDATIDHANSVVSVASSCIFSSICLRENLILNDFIAQFRRATSACSLQMELEKQVSFHKS